MKFERVRLRNFKCYGDADLRLRPGVTVIHGVNGSGKSSLLEACFFALYGSAALEGTREDVVTTGEDECEVELWFTHGGGDYHVERRLRDHGDRLSHDVVLDAPEGSYEGARDVEGAVADLLRMDAEAFVNCAYVRQGEVNKLINASASDRQDMIDDLLQLGKLEEYRERASSARLGVERVLEGKRGELEGLEDQVAQKEDADLHGTLNDLQSRLAELDAEIERYEDNREEAVETRDEAASVLERYEEQREKLERVREEVADLREAIAETERERDDLEEQIRERKAEVEAVEDERAELLAETDLDDPDAETVAERLEGLRDDLAELRDDREEHRLAAQEHESEAERLRTEADDRAERATEKREEAADLEEELAADRETLAERREKLATLDDRIESLRERFADAPVAPEDADDHWDELADELNAQRERETELEADLKNAESALAEAEELREAGKCPECGQPVEDSPHVEAIDDRRERVADLKDELVDVRAERERLEEALSRADELADDAAELAQLESDRENVAQLVAEREDALDEREATVEEFRETADELDEAAQEKRAAAEEAAERAEAEREAVAACDEEREAVEARVERLESVAETFDRVTDLEEAIAGLREQRESKAAVNEERRERLADKRDRRDELAAEFDEDAAEEARDEKARAEAYLEKVEPKLEELREERDDLTGRIGAVENEIEELEALRERREDLAATVERLESLREEAAELEEMYGRLRAELRQRNVESLERMLNDTFDLVYQNDSYARLELDGEYELTVHQKDGETLDPEQLSGGERALFNLSLRCAIYRLLAEGIEGAAPMPPLILDEPTVFLDSGHVSRLVELVESMRDRGVEQILVVSHDEELVGAADDLVTVEKNATTNRSTVTRAADAAPELVTTD